LRRLAAIKRIKKRGRPNPSTTVKTGGTTIIAVMAGSVDVENDSGVIFEVDEDELVEMMGVVDVNVRLGLKPTESDMIRL
jgi:hypothetical protein